MTRKYGGTEKGKKGGGKPYVAPAMESEPVFVTVAQKCAKGSIDQGGCGRTPRTWRS